MKSIKKTLSKEDLEVFKPLIDEAEELLKHGKGFIIYGQIRMPDHRNRIKEPEFECALVKGPKRHDMEKLSHELLNIK